jgi:hypothetical protein
MTCSCGAYVPPERPLLFELRCTPHRSGSDENRAFAISRAGIRRRSGLEHTVFTSVPR